MLYCQKHCPFQEGMSVRLLDSHAFPELRGECLLPAMYNRLSRMTDAYVNTLTGEEECSSSDVLCTYLSFDDYLRYRWFANSPDSAEGFIRIPNPLDLTYVDFLSGG